MSVKLLTEHYLELLSLKVGCTGSSESTLVKMPHRWKSHVTAQMALFEGCRPPKHQVNSLHEGNNLTSADNFCKLCRKGFTRTKAKGGNFLLFHQ